jgi:hypothetical protein
VSKPSFTKVISDFTAGDDFRYKPDAYILPDELKEEAATVTKAWMTIKVAPNDEDVDAVIQKEITPVESADGQVTQAVIDPILSSNQLEMHFNLNSAVTILLIPELNYFYDIRLLTSNGLLKVIERGLIYAFQGVTKRSS